ncbi:MAG: ribonuclease HII, partial [Nitrospirae bacterium]|nr:ribonuclease HII [Nitrospirota bacterium]
MSDLPDLAFERNAHGRGYVRIAGLDEAGRGCLAGPVVASAVVLPAGLAIPGVNDSKKLSPAKREVLYDEILKSALGFGVGIAESEEIDRINILNATRRAMERAVAGVSVSPEHLPPDYLLIDALPLPGIPLPQEALIKGDARSHTVAAASIVAKVTRDRMMREYHRIYPQYGLLSNKGYGTLEHR